MSGDGASVVPVSKTGMPFAWAARRPAATWPGSIVWSTIASTRELTRLVIPAAIFAGSPPGSTRITFQPSAFAACSVASSPSLMISAASTGPMMPIVFFGSFVLADASVRAAAAVPTRMTAAATSMTAASAPLGLRMRLSPFPRGVRTWANRLSHAARARRNARSRRLFGAVSTRLSAVVEPADQQQDRTEHDEGAEEAPRVDRAAEEQQHDQQH